MSEQINQIEDAFSQIEELRTTRLGWPFEANLNLARSIDRNLQSFQKRTHFLLEFIQNADDSGSTSFQIALDDHQMIISNNGHPFEKKNVVSICSMGLSSKDAEEYIGYLGIGFKSVFLISDQPEIYSSPYHFKFDKFHWDDWTSIPWQIIPIWISQPKYHQLEVSPFNTHFVIPFRPGLDKPTIDNLLEDFGPDKLTSRILLFLRHITSITIKDLRNNSVRLLDVKWNEYKSTDSYKLAQLTETIDGDEHSTTSYLVFRKVTSVPMSVREDEITKDWNRQHIKNREFAVVFRLDKEGQIVPEGHGTAHTGVFSYLPLKEESTGIAFSFQTDFITAPGREGVQREAEWNKWATQEVVDLVCTTCLPVFKNHKLWKYTFTQAILGATLPTVDDHPLWGHILKRILLQYLNDTPVVYTILGDFAKANMTSSLSTDLEPLLSNREWQEVSRKANANIIHPKCLTPLNLSSKIGVFDLISPSANAGDLLGFKHYKPFLPIIEERLGAGHFKWIASFIVALHADWKEANISYSIGPRGGWHQIDKLQLIRKFNIIPTANGLLGNAMNCVFAGKRRKESDQLAVLDYFVVHPAVEKVAQCRQSLEQFGVRELSIEHILADYWEREWASIPDLWAQMPEQDRMRSCERLFYYLKYKNFSLSSRELEQLSFLTIRSQSGKWLPANAMLLDCNYTAGVNYGKLIDKGFLGNSYEFVCNSYLRFHNVTADIMRRFFEVLGVNEPEIVRKAVEEVGVKVAIRYEISQGRNPTELPDRQNDAGYDIESLGNGEKRKIEVKARRETKEGCQLSAKQITAMYNNIDNWYLYYVANALYEPILYTIQANALSNAIARITAFPHSELAKAASSELTALIDFTD